MEKEIKKVLVLGSGALKIGNLRKTTLNNLDLISVKSVERRRYQLSIGKPEHRNHSDF